MKQIFFSSKSGYIVTTKFFNFVISQSGLPYLFTYKAHHFFTRKYACSMKISLKFGVRLITEYFRATIALSKQQGRFAVTYGAISSSGFV